MAFVLSSVSGNLISAASAGYAPTNSADVSAIASAYQVVSATATQLYAGTAYLTGVNAAPISAERAGNAANAALATSAWYDGTGRLISALPDSAAVSSIASAYAESAASGKQDTLAFAYNTANQISSINGSALGGMDEAAVSAIASAYQVVSSIENSNYYTGSWITGVKRINGKLIAAAVRHDGGVLATQGDISGVIDTVSSNSATWGGAGGIDSATCSAIASAYAGSAVSSVSGDYYPMTGNPSSFALSSDVSATVDIVGTQSANWGGSALALSAGPGVTLTKSGDTLVAGLDETVLFSGQTATTATMNLNEAYTNFEYIDLIGHWDYNGTDRMCAYNRIPTSASIFSLGGIGIGNTAAATYDMFMCANEYSSNGTSVVVRKVSRINLQNTLSSNSDGIIVDKIIGINRTAGV